MALLIFPFFLKGNENNTSITIGVAKNNPVLVLDKNESSVVRKSIEMFRDDILEITGQKLISLNTVANSGQQIIVGTLNQSKVLDKIIKKYRINTDSISGRWEAFSIRMISREEGNLLVIIGSDRRGTAYGILELSRQIGISPWIWWADLKPEHKKKNQNKHSDRDFSKAIGTISGYFSER